MKGKWILMGVWEGGSDEGVIDNGTGREAMMKGEWIMGLGRRQ